MSSRRFVFHPSREPASGVLPSAVCSGPWIYVSGQGPLDLATMQYVPGTIEEETEMTLAHIETILARAGAGKADVVKCTCYLSNLDDFPGFHRAFGKFFGDPMPARTTVRADLLRGIRVEIDAVAFVG
jgi:2-iminobutanoate/2-iminopropanoate deaminase